MPTIPGNFFLSENFNVRLRSLAKNVGKLLIKTKTQRSECGKALAKDTENLEEIKAKLKQSLEDFKDCVINNITEQSCQDFLSLMSVYEKRFAQKNKILKNSLLEIFGSADQNTKILIILAINHLAKSAWALFQKDAFNSEDKEDAWKSYLYKLDTQLLCNLISRIEDTKNEYFTFFIKELVKRNDTEALSQAFAKALANESLDFERSKNQVKGCFEFAKLLCSNNKPYSGKLLEEIYLRVFKNIGTDWSCEKSELHSSYINFLKNNLEEGELAKLLLKIVRTEYYGKEKLDSEIRIEALNDYTKLNAKDLSENCLAILSEENQNLDLIAATANQLLDKVPQTSKEKILEAIEKELENDNKSRILQALVFRLDSTDNEAELWKLILSKIPDLKSKLETVDTEELKRSRLLMHSQPSKAILDHIPDSQNGKFEQVSQWLLKSSVSENILQKNILELFVPGPYLEEALVENTKPSFSKVVSDLIELAA